MLDADNLYASHLILFGKLGVRQHALVCDQLRAKGFHLLLPKIDVWSRRGGLRRLIPSPLFPGYLFLPHPYLREGQRVRITRGPLAGVEGILVHSKPHKGLLVFSIELLQRSVAVEVDCTLVVAA